MAKVYYSEYFRKRLRILNTKQQAKLARLVVLLGNNPYHPQLHTKFLSGELAGLYSFRVSRDLRVLFKFLSPDELMLTDIGFRKDIYK